MFETPLVTLGRIGVARGADGESLEALALRALADGDFFTAAGHVAIGGVIVATFSEERRFPALAVRLASRLGLPPETPAFDLQMACSAFPYAVYLAGRLASDLGLPVLVVDGDVQSRLVDPSDHATGAIFSDAVTATLVSTDSTADGRSAFAFFSRADEALVCPETGPIRMDGMKVFTFVATEVRAWLKDFLSAPAVSSCAAALRFAPHQANPYMVRQLAKALGLESRLLVLDESVKNPGSCSIPLTLAAARQEGRLPPGPVLIAGFGAGYSAGFGLVRA